MPHDDSSSSGDGAHLTAKQAVNQVTQSHNSNENGTGKRHTADSKKENRNPRGMNGLSSGGSPSRSRSSSQDKDSAPRPLLPNVNDPTGLAIAQAADGTVNDADKDISSSSPSSQSRSSKRRAFAICLFGLALLAFMVNSFLLSLRLDTKGCRMSYMRPSFRQFHDFDTEHTRYASKYSLYLYREEGIDDPEQLTGVPVLFIPGNAGSYKQVRALAAESANYFFESVRHDKEALAGGVRNLDFFAADFNEDFTAFHARTMIDQAEYLNEAIRYILALYQDRKTGRDPNVPDPSSVIIIGHSMGGIVARTMLTLPNHLERSVNTIVTMSAPHARAPLSFDRAMVKLYNETNGYWLRHYSQLDESGTPSSPMTLISIAGGSLDTIVPSDYSSIGSLVPRTHGFTVFTSTIPTVWTSTDHLSILWCEQLRRVIVRSLYDVVDAKSASQTKPRHERMRAFRKRLPTGLEADAERIGPSKEPDTLLTLNGDWSKIMANYDQLALHYPVSDAHKHLHLYAIGPEISHQRHFNLLSDQRLDAAGETGTLEVLLCSVLPGDQAGTNLPFSVHLEMDSSSGDVTRTKLACINVASDSIPVPASKDSVYHPFWRDGEQEVHPFSYLQYTSEDLKDHQYVAIIDKVTDPTAAKGFVVAEFSDSTQSHTVQDANLFSLLTFGLDIQLKAKGPMVTEIRIPTMQSSLLAYHLTIEPRACRTVSRLFEPMVRQYLTEPYESKFHVNVKSTSISMHGAAPCVRKPRRDPSAPGGLTFQIWNDITCGSPVHIHLKVDWSASMGKLWMRYRTILWSFPLILVLVVIRQQFKVYDQTGEFISFSDSLSNCVLYIALAAPLLHMFWLFLLPIIYNPAYPRFAAADDLMGIPDAIALVLTPIFVFISMGICMVLNYTVLFFTGFLGLISQLGGLRRRSTAPVDPKLGTVTTVSPFRLIFWAVLMLLVSTIIPYQLAYAVVCVVQLISTARAGSSASLTPEKRNFYNYTHSILVLMLWLLPANIPILVVFVRNLTVGWLIPISPVSNALNVLFFATLVELIMMGRMPLPQGQKLCAAVDALLLVIGLFAALYGVTHAYVSHGMLCWLAGWLSFLSYKAIPKNSGAKREKDKPKGVRRNKVSEKK